MIQNQKQNVEFHRIPVEIRDNKSNVISAFLGWLHCSFYCLFLQILILFSVFHLTALTSFLPENIWFLESLSKLLLHYSRIQTDEATVSLAHLMPVYLPLFKSKFREKEPSLLAKFENVISGPPS